MKTAMQELIELIRFTDKECYATMFNEGLFDKALEKEKEQIMNAWKDNRDMIYYDNDKDELSENTSMELGEQYYNQTYNPVRDESEDAFKHFADNADITITFNRNS
jgi:hypothetical protein